jgi:membrane-associated phospholipid phosphatase
MYKSLAKGVSILFHPLFVLFYILLILMVVNPILFSTDLKARNIVVFTIFMLTVFIPLISILMMRALGFIQSFLMVERTERIAPLIVTSIFYLWTYINLKSSNILPLSYQAFVLGSTIALFGAFFINNFSKISLHTVGIGGLMAAIFLIRYNVSYAHFNIIVADKVVKIDTDLLVWITLIIGGLVGTARIYLKAHKPSDVYGGYIVGFLSQMIAWNILN